MNHPDVPRSQGKHAGGPAGAVSPAVLEQISLEQVIGRSGPAVPQWAAVVGLAVLDQIVAVHNRGMLHGDVRPGSVLLGPQGQIVLMEPTFRSPTFTAPEGVTGPAADLWSLGATLYTAVEGRPPSPGGAFDNAGPLAPVLFGLLSGDPAQRPDPGTVRNVLLDISQNRGGTIPATPSPAPADAPPVPSLLTPSELETTPPPLAAETPARPSGPETASPSLLPSGPETAPPPFNAETSTPPPVIVSPDAATPPPLIVSPDAITPPPPFSDNPEETSPHPIVISAEGVTSPSPGASPLQASPSPDAPASRELVPASGPSREVLPVPARPDGPTGPTGRSGRRAGVLVPRSVVALTGVLLVGMAATIGVLLTSALGDSGKGDPVAEPASGAGGRFATAPRTCSLLDDKQVEELVPGFTSSEVEPGACDWLNQHDWRKPSPEKYDLRIRLVAQKQDASGVQRAKEYLSGKKNDFVTNGKFATPKPQPPQDLKGIGEEAFTTGGYNSINLYGGSYKVTVVFRVSNLIAEVAYERGGVKEDRGGEIAQGAQKAARWLTESLKTNG
ncbi:hypothetical protein [Streptosporangium sp. NPDC000396]|uniref:hypothetical protein n=1 Tax=Streptosporangium sp. NPDC000396 TaxID=3366185 RepID=UPI00368F6F17